MVSGQSGLVIMLVIGCLLLAIISLLFQRTFPHFFVREKVVIDSFEEEAIPQVKETVHIPKIEEDIEFLSGGDFAMEDQSSMRVRCDKDQRYMSQAAKDLSWLDTWQTKTHRRSEFAKSMMALILPPTPQSGELPDEEPIEVKDSYDEEMLVVPVNMTAGICDHNLAMGVFLWSPSRSRSKCSVEKDDILGGSTSVQLSDRYMQRKSHTACNTDHTPSPVTVPSSASMSALSSAKSSLSVACGMLNQGGYSKSSGRNDMAYEMKEKLGRYMKAPSYPTSPSSSSASALSPPPPSTASCYTSRQVSDGQWGQHQKSRYPLRYLRDQEVNPDEFFKNFHSPKLHRDNTNVSSISPPTTREIGSPAKKALRDILEGVAKRHDTHHFHSPYE